MITWILTATIRDGQADALQTLLTSMAAGVQADEPGTLGYQFFLSGDKTTLQAIETYEDSDAALKHLGGFGKHAEAFMSLVEMSGLVVYGNPSETFRGAVAGFGPTYFSSFGGFRR